MVCELKYRPGGVAIEALELGECTIRPARSAGGECWWNLWFYVPRDLDGVPETFVVPINIGGAYIEHGPGGRTWGFTCTVGGDSQIWQVSPSINVLSDDDARLIVAGHAPTGQSLWHQTPVIVGVPAGEIWVS